MVRWLAILVWTLRFTIRTQRELALENLALRQQVAVWKVRQPRPQLTTTDGSSGSCCRGCGRTGGVLCRWCGPRPWCGGTVRASGATGHGRVDADGVGPRLGGTCRI